MKDTSLYMLIKRAVAVSGKTPQQIEDESYMMSTRGNSIKKESVYRYVKGTETPSPSRLKVLEKVLGVNIYSRHEPEWAKQKPPARNRRS